MRDQGIRQSSLFHVGRGPIAPGQQLRPYELATKMAGTLDLVRRALVGEAPARSELLTADGHLRRQFSSNPEVGLVILEAIFERVRAEIAPGLPSRLESVFLWPTTELAFDFRRRFLPNGTVHRCRIETGTPLPRDATFVVAGVKLSAVLDQEARNVEQRARSYWTTSEEIAYPEVLVRGTVVVTEVPAAED